MKIRYKNDRVFFTLAQAEANIAIKNNIAFLELIKVDIDFRRQHLATELLQKIIDYCKDNHLIQIQLSPLPLDISECNQNDLIIFYKKYGFRVSKDRNCTYPYLMELNL